MNSLQIILYFKFKMYELCQLTYLRVLKKDYLRRSFIVVFLKVLRDQLHEYAIKKWKFPFIIFKVTLSWPDLDDATQGHQTDKITKWSVDFFKLYDFVWNIFFKYALFSRSLIRDLFFILYSRCLSANYASKYFQCSTEDVIVTSPIKYWC